MSDVVWQSLIAAVATVIMSVIGGVLAYLQLRLEKAVDTARRTGTEEASDLMGVAQQTHTLVNSGKQLDLQIAMIALKRLAEVTDNADDKAAANLAEQRYQAHMNAQIKINDREDARKDARDDVKENAAALAQRQKEEQS